MKNISRTVFLIYQVFPSEDTFNRFFTLLDIEWFEEIFRLWINDICSPASRCRCYRWQGCMPNSPFKGAWDERSFIYGQCMGRTQWALSGTTKVDGKSNEITAIPELIKALDLAQCIVTIDAVGCQKAITETIIDAEADYILCVKDNQKKLKAQIFSLLTEEDRIYLPYKQSYFQQNDGHGRKEYRECVCDAAFYPEHFMPVGRG